MTVGYYGYLPKLSHRLRNPLVLFALCPVSLLFLLSSQLLSAYKKPMKRFSAQPSFDL